MDTQPVPEQSDGKPRHVTVFGGGLSGMAATCELLRHGVAVTLVERRPYLGGRAYSFVDRETDCQVDNGQHVFLGCCTEYIGFLRELGVLHKAYIQPRLRIQVYGSDGRYGELAAWPLLPPPLHLLWSFLRYPHISMGDKLRAFMALLRLWRVDRSRHPELEEETFYSWLRRHKQSERAIDHFWNLIVLPTLNDDVRVVSADMGFMVFQDGLLRDRHGGDVGYSRVSLSELMGDAAMEHIRRLGGEVLLGSSVQQIHFQDGRVASVELADGGSLASDAYISALPFDAMLSVLPEQERSNDFFSQAAGLEWSPIVDVHIWYDRPVADFDFAAFVGSPVQWVFNKSAMTGHSGPGQYICVSLSGAWEHWPRSKQALKESIVQELASVLPMARQANVERVVVVKSQKATFRCLPGVATHRLPARTPLTNLFLAGEWTATGWPSTMEGAVRSGHKAARLAMGIGET